MLTYSDTYTLVQELVQEQKIKNALGELTKRELIYSALESLSSSVPFEKVAVLVSDSVGYYSLPADFDDEFSTIKEIEFPIMSTPKSVIDAAFYEIDKTPTATILRFNEYNPNGNFWVRYTVPYVFGSLGITNIPDRYKRALVYRAASLWCRAMANYFATKTDANIRELAPISDFSNRVSEWNTLSKNYDDEYLSIINNKKNSTTGVIGNINQEYVSQQFFDRDLI